MSDIERLRARVAEAEAAIKAAHTNFGALSPSVFRTKKAKTSVEAAWAALDNYHFRYLRAADAACGKGEG